MKKTVLCCAFSALLLTACTTPGARTGWGAAGGAAGGALAGAIIANNTGGSGGQGAVIGALAGAAVGGLIGNYYDKQAKELAAIATVEKVKDANGTRLIVTLKNDILFTSGSATLSPQAVSTLQDLSRVLKKYPENNIIVEGNADSTGSAATNEKLSQQRAQAVYNYLLGTGLKTNSIRYVGYGSNNPVASNNTATGRAANRRVNLQITANEKLVQKNRG